MHLRNNHFVFPYLELKMNSLRILPLALLAAIIFSTSSTLACSSPCCNLSLSAMPNAAASLMMDAVHTANKGVVVTAHTGCTVIREAPKQLAAIPDALSTSMSGVETAANSFSNRMLGFVQAAGQAVINLSASLLRIVFSSFSALVSAISPF
jgi:hypothetical protein